MLFALVDSTVLLTVIVVVGTSCVYYITAKNKSNVPKGPRALQPDTTLSLPLLEKESLSHNVFRYRLGLPTPKHILGLPIGQHISLKYFTEEGKLVSRPYTPVTSDDELGYVDIVVKVYFKNEHPKFPNGGKMSQHLNSLKIGETIDVSGPKGKLSYQGKGLFHIKHRARDTTVDARSAKCVGMIAGGTGITPMLQIVRQALKDPKDNTEFHLLFANQSESDILLRSELDEMQSAHPNVKVWYTIDNAKDAGSWKYSTGFVNVDMIKEHLPSPGPDTQMLLCGPPAMIKFAVIPALEELGFNEKMHFTF